MKKKLGILLYNDVQSMDFIGLWEVFSCWKNNLQAPLDMCLISEFGNYVHCMNEITVKTHCNFNNSPAIDYLFIPGGIGRVTEINNEQLILFIKNQAKNAQYILSVCTGMFLLHKAELLHNESVTTYWRALPEAKSLADVQIVEERIVKNGKFWFAGGISSSIDLAFAFIAEIAGEEQAGKLQLLFEYFPKHQVYCKVEQAENLLSYYSSKPGEKSYLPQYINEYIEEYKKVEPK
jgi:transcriptional regulator GlxA family with amidase domain